jgi:hypothetical protein
MILQGIVELPVFKAILEEGPSDENIDNKKSI